MKDVRRDRKISVAIVTARSDEQTSYARWQDLRNAFLAGDDTWTSGPVTLDLGKAPRRHRYLSGEFGALLAACFNGGGIDPVRHHVEYQLRALACQTSTPDKVFVVSRLPPPEGWDVDEVPWEAPMVSAKELELAPEAACHHLMGDAPRSTAHSFGCADKNTALVLCETELLIMLDDCCLPGFGLVERAREACVAGQIMMFQHRQLYLPTKERPDIEISDANVDLAQGHRVFGIFASPLRYLLDVNGWNTALDGQRGSLDAELLARMDAYTKMRGVAFETSPNARVYEIEHDYPWAKETYGDMPAPSGYYAPGPNLREIREKVQAQLNEEYDGQEESEEDWED